MIEVEEMLKLLYQKQELFEEYEALTIKMLGCDTEELEDFLSRRQELIPRIDEQSADLDELAGRLSGDAHLAREAMRLSCERSDLPDALHPLFDQSQRICAVVNRIIRCEPQLADRIEGAMDELVEKIKENNRSVSANAAKFQAVLMRDTAGARQLGKA